MNANTSAALMSTQESAPYVDKRRYGWLLGPSIPVIGFGALSTYKLFPKIARPALLFAPALAHGIIPLLDKILGDDTSNPPSDAFSRLEADKYYERAVKAFVPLQLAMTVYAAWMFSRKDVPLIDKIMGGISVGYVNGVAVAIAHELGHKTHKKDNQIFSYLTLMPIGYAHFPIEHNFGHHLRVSTPEDPASSKMGESFYQFWPRTVAGGIKSAIHIQKTRLARRGEGFFTPGNALLLGWGAAAAFHTAIIAGFGRRVLPFWITQAIFGFSLFELINYVEHYGLMRQKRANGQYERTMPEHSWNSNSIIGNLFLYNLQRHSDHHANPTRVYQNLRNFPEAPTYPKGTGYAGMLIPALIPPLWRKIMDQRLVNHYKGDLSRINMYEPKREDIYKKFNFQPKIAQVSDALKAAEKV